MNNSDEKITIISNIKKKYNKFKINCSIKYDNLKPYIRLSLEFSKIILGCLLFIFVPKLCDGPDDNTLLLITKYNINITSSNIRHT